MKFDRFKILEIDPSSEGQILRFAGLISGCRAQIETEVTLSALDLLSACGNYLRCGIPPWLPRLSLWPGSLSDRQERVVSDLMAVLTTRVLVIASLLLVLSLDLHLHHLVQAEQLQSTINAQTTTIDCGAACATRCQQSKRPRLCQRSCGSCCFRCQCVPPGTSGNYEACPCYATMTTRGNKPKCP
ncbi:snakin-2-like [Telopea speciosissima]|uniref:snakin-2-like n=1 Tax=Telopea speciosissima TaxID=54955 RepID=UPI001CC4233D|nr:snakin-2-like [Telopea speciosissima]